MKIGPKKTLFKFGKRIKEVSAIDNHTDVSVETKEDLAEIVDEPCLKACQALFDKNIQTVDSGCNGENCSNRAYITINYDTLNEKNQKAANMLINKGIAAFLPKDEKCMRSLYNKVEIEIPVSPNDFVVNVEKKLLFLTRFFSHQEKIKKKMDLSYLKQLGLIPDRRM